MSYKDYIPQVDRYIAENRENIIASIKRLVDIPSVEGAPQPGMPYGPGPAKALAEAAG